MAKKASITGVTGQDGAYLAEFLLEQGYEAHGIKRRSSLFNTDRIDHLYQDLHESDRRFILHTLKITRDYLENLNALRDWGHARDYVRMRWSMLQQDTPEDYVIASGEQHSVREFVDAAATALDMKIQWEGRGVDERGYDSQGRCVVAVDSRYFRPTEVETLLGDARKAREQLGWEPVVSSGFSDGNGGGGSQGGGA